MELVGTHGQTIEWGYPRPPRLTLTSKLEVEEYAFQIAAKRLEIDENVNRARLIRHLLTSYKISVENFTVS